MTSLPLGSKDRSQIHDHRCVLVRPGELAGNPQGVWGPPSRRLQGPGPRGRLSCPAVCCHSWPNRVLFVATNSFRKKCIFHRGAKCLLETLSSRREAGAGREDLQPHTNPSQLWLALKCDHLMQSREGKQRARKPLLRGVWGVNLKP